MKLIYSLLIMFSLGCMSQLQAQCTPNASLVEDNYIGTSTCNYKFCRKWLNLNQHEDCDNWDGWILVEKDEFNQNSLDLSKWKDHLFYGINTVNYWNNDNSVYVPNYPEGFVFNTNGSLSLVTGYTPSNFEGKVRDDMEDDDIVNDSQNNKRAFTYSSAQIQTNHRFPKGKWQLNCKIPKNDFMWPAFWNYRVSNNNQCYSEVDGFEFYRENTKVAGQYVNCYHATYNACPRFSVHMNHCDFHSRGDHQMKYHCSTNFTNAFHVFDYEWDPQKVIWSIDGDIRRKLYKWIGIAGLHQHNPCSKIHDPGYHKEVQIMPNVTNMPLFINSGLLNLECATGYPGTPFPDNLDLDYVRFYMRIDCGKTLNLSSYNPDGYGNESPTCYAAGMINVAGNGNSVFVPGEYTNKHPPNGIDWSYDEFLSLVASSEINLYDGFDTELDATFNAVIRPCSTYIIQGAVYDTSASVNINTEELAYAYIPKEPEDSVIGEWAIDSVEIVDTVSTYEVLDDSLGSYKTDELNGPINAINKKLTPDELEEKGGFEIAPNPANNNVRITYLLPSDGELSIDVYDIKGTKIRNLFKGYQYGGTGQLDYCVTNLAQDVYIIQMESKFGTQKSKLVITH